MATIDRTRERGRESGEDRSRERSRGRGRGALINYYGDMGQSTTEEGREAYQEWRGDWQENVALADQDLLEREQSISEYAGQVDAWNSEVEGSKGNYETFAGQVKAAQNELSGLKYEPEPFSFPSWKGTWQNVQKQMTPVRVVNGNSVEGTYWIPAGEVTEWLKGNGFTTYSTVKAGTPSGKALNVSVRQPAGVRGAELHTAFSTFAKTYQNNSLADYKTTRAGANNAYNVAYNTGLAAFNTAYAEQAQIVNNAIADRDAWSTNLNTAQQNLAGSKQSLGDAQGKAKAAREYFNEVILQDEEHLQTMRDNYSDKIDRMRGIFNGMGDSGEFTEDEMLKLDNFLNGVGGPEDVPQEQVAPVQATPQQGSAPAVTESQLMLAAEAAKQGEEVIPQEEEEANL